MGNTQGYKDPLYMQKWRAAHKEQMLRTGRAYYQAHRAQCIEASKRVMYRHYDRHLIGMRAVNATKRYPGQLTRADVMAIFDRDKRTCYWCGRTELTGRMLTIEHLKPINDIAHITTACLPCNASRRAVNGPPDPAARRAAKTARQRIYRAEKKEQARARA